MKDPRLECCDILQEFWDNNDPLTQIYNKNKEYNWFSEERKVKDLILERLRPIYNKTIDNYFWDPYSGLLEAGLKNGHLIVYQDIEELQKTLQAWYNGEYITSVQVSGHKWRIKYDRYIHGWSIVEDLGKHQVPGELKNLEFLESIFPGQYVDRIDELTGKINPKIYYHITKTGINPIYPGQSNDKSEVKRIKKLERRKERRKRRGRK